MNQKPIAYEGTEPYIFVSYSHKDSDQVLRILSLMQENGFRLWFDHGIEAGTEWPEYIEERLIGCDRLLVFLSNAAVASLNCRNEINLALALKKEILIVYLEETTLRYGLMLQLSSVQALFYHRHTSELSFCKELFSSRLLSACKEKATARKSAEISPSVKQEKPSLKKKASQEASQSEKITSSDKKISKPTANGAVAKTTPKIKAEKPLPYALQPNASQKLDFVSVNNGKSYFVSGVGACRDSIVVIPTVHNGLPVTGCKSDAFRNASGVVGLSIPESFKGILDNNFERHNGLMQVTVAGGVKTIGNWAFRESGVVRVTLEDGIKSIGRFAFAKCKELSEILLPATLTQIGDFAFSDCIALTCVTIPKGIKSIPEYAFSGCSSLSSVTFSDSLGEIGANAFTFCSHLSEIQFPKKLKTIADDAFSYCNLSRLELPCGLLTIGTNAFYNNSLRYIRIPASVQSIGANAFTGSIYRPASLETEVIFGGTLAQWKNVLKAPSWCERAGIRVVHCTDGDDIL